MACLLWGPEYLDSFLVGGGLDGLYALWLRLYMDGLENKSLELSIQAPVPQGFEFLGNEP